MAIGLQEIHPALVHLSIALLPLAVGADVFGSVTDNELFLSFGQKAICVAAAGAWLPPVTGLIAGGEVDDPHDHGRASGRSEVPVRSKAGTPA
jgi:uncharacterized membrane protein